MTAFGQIVIGPPGSGKSTYCKAMQDFMTGLGRKVAVINLDPANEGYSYKCAVDIMELITPSDVMDHYGLGPNGGLVFCMEYLEQNVDWLEKKLQATELSEHYLLFDCPGQVELYTHNKAIYSVFERLTQLEYRLAAVHLADARYCTDPSNFISVVLTSLTAMMQVARSHINVLSKVDLIEKYGKLDYNLDFYTEVQDLSYLLDHIVDDDPFMKKYKKLNEALVDVIQSYGLVSFIPLHIEDRVTMLRVMSAVDRANGYYSASDKDQTMVSLLANTVPAEFQYDKIGSIQEKYISNETVATEDDEIALEWEKLMND